MIFQIKFSINFIIVLVSIALVGTFLIAIFLDVMNENLIADIVISDVENNKNIKIIL